MRDPDVDRLLADSTHPMTAGVRRLRSAVLDGVEGLTAFSSTDPSGLLQWRGADRAVVTWTDAQALDDAVPDVVDPLVRWVRA